MPDIRRVVVVGAGLAGLRTVTELRAQGYDGDLLWWGAEGAAPYDRPPLSKELLSRPDPVWLAEDLGVDLAALTTEHHPERAATGLAIGPGAVTVRSVDEVVTADAVVVATGAQPVQPWPVARVLHGLPDAEGLRAALLPGSRLVVVGAGWIGAEVAGVAAAAGCHVTVLEAGPTPLWRQLGPHAGERTRDWYAAAGVELRTGVMVRDVERDAVVLADGERVAADVVLSAVGVRPRTSWLGDAVPLTSSGHLATTRGGRTARPGVWAVGDVAARETALLGVVPGGHWFAALRDPALLAADLLGLPLPPVEPAPEVFSDQLGHHLEVLGRLADAAAGEHRLLREHATGWTELQLHGTTLVGAVVVDHPREVSAVRKLLRGGALPDLDLGAAADPATPLPRAVLPG